jgi:hypothetical protein
MPKTRTSVVIWLILLTVSVITILFTFFPKQHSLAIYKASIIETKNKYFPKQIINKKNTIKENINESTKTKTWILNKKQTTSSWIIKNSKTPISKIIKETNIEVIKKIKIKNALNKKYKIQNTYIK